MGAYPLAGLEQVIVCEEIGELHDMRAETVLCVKHQTGRVAERVSQRSDATVPENVGDEPSPDIRSVTFFQSRRQDRAELHEVAEQHGAPGRLGYGEKYLGQRGRTHLVDEDDVVWAFEDSLSRAEAGECSGYK